MRSKPRLFPSLMAVSLGIVGLTIQPWAGVASLLWLVLAWMPGFEDE